MKFNKKLPFLFIFLMLFVDVLISQNAQAVYTCGGVNDDCQCGVYNNFTCCDNGGNCTWWAWHKVCCIWGETAAKDIANWITPRHAHTWNDKADASSVFTVRSYPSKNTIAVGEAGSLWDQHGHVAWVESVEGDQITVSEMQCCDTCFYGKEENIYPIDYFKGGFIYLSNGNTQKPQNIIVTPPDGTWDTSSKWIDINCPGADQIYCKANVTTDGSEPPTPSTPTTASHDQFDQTGTPYISGETGQFQLWAAPGEEKKIKVKFVGYNSEGYGPVSDTHSYTIYNTETDDATDYGFRTFEILDNFIDLLEQGYSIGRDYFEQIIGEPSDDFVTRLWQSDNFWKYTSTDYGEYIDYILGQGYVSDVLETNIGGEWADDNDDEDVTPNPYVDADDIHITHCKISEDGEEDWDHDLSITLSPGESYVFDLEGRVRNKSDHELKNVDVDYRFTPTREFTGDHPKLGDDEVDIAAFDKESEHLRDVKVKWTEDMEKISVRHDDKKETVYLTTEHKTEKFMKVYFYLDVETETGSDRDISSENAKDEYAKIEITFDFPEPDPNLYIIEDTLETSNVAIDGTPQTVFKAGEQVCASAEFGVARSHMMAEGINIGGYITQSAEFENPLELDVTPFPLTSLTGSEPQDYSFCFNAPSSPGQYAVWVMVDANNAITEMTETDNLASTLITVEDPGGNLLPGDVNNDNAVDLADAVFVLKILNGIGEGYINLNADVDGDHTIGLEEAIFILRDLSDVSAPCAYDVSLTSGSFNSSGGSATAEVSTSGGCVWTFASDSAWIDFTTQTQKTGSGSIGFTVEQNFGTSSRSGTMTVASKTFTITQGGISCAYSINSDSDSFGATGGAGSVGVTAPTGCDWSAASNNNWIVIDSNSTGSGNGTVGYTVLANTSESIRSGTITIADKTFSISQSGLACNYSISKTNDAFTATGGTGSVDVTASSGTCGWSASESLDWVIITAGGSGAGNGTVNYSVDPNTATTSRNGNLTIAGKTLAITQDPAPCTYSIAPTNNTIVAAGGSGTITVTAGSGCQWSASSGATWIVITSGASGTGGGSVGYSVSANADTNSREGTLTIAGKTFTVTQSGGAASGNLVWDGGNWDESNWN